MSFKINPLKNVNALAANFIQTCKSLITFLMFTEYSLGMNIFYLKNHFIYP